jgi:DUF1009 family protein
MSAKLGILAGGGKLPGQLIAAACASGRELFVLAIRGHADPTLTEGLPHAWIRLGEAATGFDLLRANGVEEVVMAGAVRRPSFAEMRPDFRTAQFFARVGLKGVGDDGILKALVGELEKEGFRVVGVQSVLGGRMLAEMGPWGAVRPDVSAEVDIARGLAVCRALGGVDVGQATVVQQGIVLAVEAAEGTEALLARAGQVRRAGVGGVLVKIAKPGQDRRMDLPTIGVETVRQALAAGLAGIAVEAGATIVIDGPAVVAEADAAGLFVCGITATAAGATEGRP